MSEDISGCRKVSGFSGEKIIENLFVTLEKGKSAKLNRNCLTWTNNMCVLILSYSVNTILLIRSILSALMRFFVNLLKWQFLTSFVCEILTVEKRSFLHIY